MIQKKRFNSFVETLLLFSGRPFAYLYGNACAIRMALHRCNPRYPHFWSKIRLGITESCLHVGMSLRTECLALLSQGAIETYGRGTAWYVSIFGATRGRLSEQPTISQWFKN